jgi:hypothetical protein
VLHIATLSGVLNCLMRHFRASLASLPLLAQPLGQLPIGTWAPDHQFALAAGGAGGVAATAAASAAAAGGPGGSAALVNGGVAANKAGGSGREAGVRNVSTLHAVTPGTSLTTALGMLLDAGVGLVMAGFVLQLALATCRGCVVCAAACTGFRPPVCCSGSLMAPDSLTLRHTELPVSLCSMNPTQFQH